MNILRSIVAGVLIASWMFFLTLAISIVMVGTISPHLIPHAIGAALAACLTLMISYVLIGGSAARQVGLPTIISGVLMVPMLENTVVLMKTQASVATIDTVLLAMIPLTSMIVGAAFLIMRFTALSTISRYLPLPVISGFLLAVVWTGIIQVVNFSSGRTVEIDSFTALADVFTVEFVNGALLCLLLLTIARYFRAQRILPLVLIAIVYGDYFLTNVVIEGIIDTNYSQTWLRRESVIPFNEETITNILDIPLFVVQANFFEMIAITLVLFFLSIYFASLYTSSSKKHQLSSPGVGNLLAGFIGGGPPGISSRVTLRNLSHPGVIYHLTGVVVICLLIAGLFWGHFVLDFVPAFVIYGLVLYLLIDLFIEWFLNQISRSTRLDLGLMVLVGFVSIQYGFRVSIPLGMLLAAVSFVRSYLRVSIFRLTFDCSWYHSSTDHRETEYKTLQEIGGSARGYVLHNYMFYGAEGQLIAKLEADTKQANGILNAVILDFEYVQGFDSTAYIGLRGFFNLIESLECNLILTSLTPNFRSRIQDIVPSAMNERVNFFPTLDSGVSYAERILLRRGEEDVVESVKIETWLARETGSVDDAAAIYGSLKQQKFTTGQPLITQDSAPDSMYFIVSGSVEIILDSVNRRPIRLRRVTAGNITGEIGFYARTRRSASVIADSECTVYVLYRESYEKLLEENPRAVKSLNHLVILNLARSLQRNNQLLRRVL